MRSVTTVLCAGVAAVALAWAAPARADQFDELTYFTFSAPVELPGVTLPAGTYTFKHLDSSADRHIVQVMNKDQTKIYATILAIPDTRLTPADKPVVTFEETPAGTPEAIKAWFYPGDTVGDEFVYPEAEALRIAKATHQPVLATANALPATSPTTARAAERTSVSRVNESGQTEPLHSEQSARVAPMKSLAETNTNAPVATSGQSGTAAHSAQAANRPARTKRLPATASNLPLVALLSLSLFGLAAGVRLFARTIRDAE